VPVQAIEIAAAAVGLGVDAFSVCLAVGTRWHGPRQKFRLSWHMGLFQFMMPVIGYYASQVVADAAASAGPWIAMAVLVVIGGKMIHQATAPRAAEKAVAPATDPTHGWSLMALSVATSLDALAVGFAVGLRGDGSVWWPSLIIGLTAGGMALAGVALGKHASLRFGRAAEVAGGVLLVALGVYMVLA